MKIVKILATSSAVYVAENNVIEIALGASQIWREALSEQRRKQLYSSCTRTDKYREWK